MAKELSSTIQIDNELYNINATAAEKVKNSLTVKVTDKENNTTETTSYNGSAGKTINITGGGATSVSADTNGNITITSSDTTEIPITASAKDDGVVILKSSGGTDAVAYEASHAMKGPSNISTTTKGATADVAVTADGSTKTIKIPKVTTDQYGHTTGLTEQTLSITIPATAALTSKNIVGDSTTATANAQAANGSVYLNHLEKYLENSTVASTHKITGAGATTVTSDANGNITISSTDADYSGIAYCTTAAAAAEKVATMPKFALVHNQIILLRLNVSNTATSNVTLNVNDTGAKPIKIGDSSTVVNATNLPKGDYLATYDGSNWILIRVFLTDTVYTHPTPNAAGTYQSVTVDNQGHVTSGSTLITHGTADPTASTASTYYFKY